MTTDEYQLRKTLWHTRLRWGYETPVSGIVTVQTYTLFGIPAETWVVDCRSETVTRAWWRLIP